MTPDRVWAQAVRPPIRATRSHDGGVLRRPVRQIIADDVCGVGSAEAAARQLVEAGVRFVAGHLCSHSSLMAAAFYEAASIPMMSTTSSHPRLTEEGRRNVFRLIGRDDVQGRIAGSFLAERWWHGSKAILHDGSTYGLGLAEHVRRQLHADGVKEVLYLTYTPGAADYGPIVEQLQRAAAAMVYIGGYGPDAARILRQARERGDDIQLVGGHALGMPEFWSIAGALGEGTIFTGRRDAGVGPEDQRVLRELQARGLGQHPTALPVTLRSRSGPNGSADPTFDLAAVTRGLHRGRFGTVLGWVDFDAKGDLEGAAWQWQVWRGGDYEPLEPTMTR